MIKDVEIDLTEHRDFGVHHFFVTDRRDGTVSSNISDYINSVVKKQMYGDIPWNVIPIYAEGKYKYDGLVALGNKEQRKKEILMHTWGTIENKECDCCGKEYSKIPWIKDFGLCKNCREDNKQIKIPWK